MKMLLVQVSAPLASATVIAQALLDARLAACVQIIPQVLSFYRWQGAVQQDTEALMLIKTQQQHWLAVQALVLGLHPYELPEVIAVHSESVHPAYLQWLITQTSPLSSDC